jgi:hypothetical protein
MAQIFYEHMSSEISMAYKENLGPVLVLTKYDSQSGRNRQMEVYVSEDEWKQMKAYMEKVYP